MAKTLGERMKARRKKLGLSQSELAVQVGLSYAQIGRYETKDVQPSAETLKKIAETLEISVEFLMYGSSEEKVQNTLSDVELINQFKAIQEMEEKDQWVIKELIDAFITRKVVEKLTKKKN